MGLAQNHDASPLWKSWFLATDGAPMNTDSEWKICISSELIGAQSVAEPPHSKSG